VWVVLVLILVGELEGHVLQPLLLGRAVRLHPLAVVLPVATGFLLIGVIGALLAVPVVAVVDAGIRSLYQPNPPNPDTVDPLNPRSARPLNRKTPQATSDQATQCAGQQAESEGVADPLVNRPT
jgi:putative heme transporter